MVSRSMWHASPPSQVCFFAGQRPFALFSRLSPRYPERKLDDSYRFRQTFTAPYFYFQTFVCNFFVRITLRRPKRKLDDSYQFRQTFATRHFTRFMNFELSLVRLTVLDEHSTFSDTPSHISSFKKLEFELFAALLNNSNMFFCPLKRPFAIAFASLFIFGSISVTLSVAIPASDVSSSGLVRAHVPPKISATVSFPTDDVQDAYPLFLNETDLDALQKLVVEKIAKDIQHLLQNNKLSTLEGKDLGVAKESQLRIFRKISERRYIVPYDVEIAGKKFQGMTLEMWNVDKDGIPVNPKARLCRSGYVEKHKDPKLILKAELIQESLQPLLEIASRSKFVIVTFTEKASKALKPVQLEDIYEGMLNTLRAFTDLIVVDIIKSLGHNQLLATDVKFEGLPSVLESSKRYAVAYELKHMMSGYSGGQLEVLKQERKEIANKKKNVSRGQVRRFKDPSDEAGSVHILKPVEQVEYFGFACFVYMFMNAAVFLHVDGYSEEVIEHDVKIIEAHFDKNGASRKQPVSTIEFEKGGLND
ncbi:hypothetical protein F5878DRAFT_645922 [Lentinula raphanica]|uniref:Uncharacterized protein n=1 Tax=Lentinula raphanica TaxID=153919 RepID=A0AA38NZF8_9AGAR|nr:hypothetical protein F5878DRAFT_645922 [Lentinula raphanica]